MRTLFRRVGARLGVLAGFTALTLVLTAPLAWRLGSGGPTNTGDGQMSIWNISWVARALVIDPVHVYDANIFAPHRSTLAYSEANLPAGALGLPAWWLSRNAYAAYNTSVILAFLTSALATFGLVRRLTASAQAAAVSAILFAFAPFAMVRYAHIQLLVTAGLSLSLWAFHRFVDRPGIVRALTLSGALALAGLCSGYYGFFAGIAVALGMVYYGIRGRWWRSPKVLALCLLAPAGAALLILPFFLPYIALLENAEPFRTLADARQYSATWRSYLTSASHVHRALLGGVIPFEQAAIPERVLFPGFVALGLAAVALVGGPRHHFPGGPASVPARSPSPELAGFYTLLIAVSGWLSLGPAGGLYTLAYRVVPAWSLLRAPSRFGTLVALALAVLAGIGLAETLRRISRPRLVAAAVGVLAVCELASVPLDVRDPIPVPPAHRLLAKLPAGAVAEFPFFWEPVDFHRQAIYMLYSTAHWHPIVNGYSDHVPDDFKAMAVPVSGFPSWEAFGLLRRHGTRYVVFHLNLYDRRSREKLLERIDRYKEFIEPLLEQDEVWIYEIVKWPE